MKFLDSPRSGSYQGLTFSRNRFGQYLRTRATPVNPSSTFQQTARARLTQAAQTWRDLTTTQKDGWASLGGQIERTDSLGQSYFLNGFMAYCLVNLNKLDAGDAVLTDAPLFAPPEPITTLALTLTSASFSLAYTVTPLAAGERLFISTSPQRSAGRGFEGDLRLCVVTAAAAASPANCLAAYQARFGTPVTGNRIFVSAQRYFGGFLSQPLLISQVVA